MIYQKTITTPYNTSISDRVKTVLQLTRGLIYKVEVVFPPGSSGLMGIRVMEKSVALYPVNDGEWFTGDNHVLSYEDKAFCVLPPYQYVIETYNLDTNYNHIGVVRLGLITNDDIIKSYMPQSEIQKLIDYIEKQKQASNELSEEDKDVLQFVQGLSQ